MNSLKALMVSGQVCLGYSASSHSLQRASTAVGTNNLVSRCDPSRMVRCHQVPTTEGGAFEVQARKPVQAEVGELRTATSDRQAR